jgi:COP9 signalosome complex subunit 6
MTSMDISVDSNTNSAIVSHLQSSSGLSISVYKKKEKKRGKKLIKKCSFRHPLVLLNISDHYTRTKLQYPTVVENGIKEIVFFFLKKKKNM